MFNVNEFKAEIDRHRYLISTQIGQLADTYSEFDPDDLISDQAFHIDVCNMVRTMTSSPMYVMAVMVSSAESISGWSVNPLEFILYTISYDDDFVMTVADNVNVMLGRDYMDLHLPLDMEEETHE